MQTISWNCRNLQNSQKLIFMNIKQFSVAFVQLRENVKLYRDICKF